MYTIALLKQFLNHIAWHKHTIGDIQPELWRSNRDNTICLNLNGQEEEIGLFTLCHLLYDKIDVNLFIDYAKDNS